MPDHEHLFIEANHFDLPTNIIKIFKGESQNIQEIPNIYDQDHNTPAIIVDVIVTYLR